MSNEDGSTEMAQPDACNVEEDCARGWIDQPYDLKFVPTNVNDVPGGGWYRELPDGQIEVMTRAQFACVPLGNENPEAKARTVVKKLIKQQSARTSSPLS